MENREIKFRAWEVDWYNKNLKQNQGRMIQWEDIRDDFATIQDRTSYFHLMQYTELTDRNGKEIYEGDVVVIDKEYVEMFKLSGDPKEVYFMAGAFVLNMEKLNTLSYFVDAKTTSNLFGKVIGNIYENPELIK